MFAASLFTAAKIQSAGLLVEGLPGPMYVQLEYVAWDWEYF